MTLVERVAEAIAEQGATVPARSLEPEARAAIREVADWFGTERTGIIGADTELL